MASKKSSDRTSKLCTENALMIPACKEVDAKQNEPESKYSIDNKLVDRSVRFINKAIDTNAHRASKKIAQYILKNFYNNDIQLARSKNPRKERSYRSLCCHPDLMTSPASLSDMLAVELQEEFLNQM